MCSCLGRCCFVLGLVTSPNNTSFCRTYIFNLGEHPSELFRYAFHTLPSLASHNYHRLPSYTFAIPDIKNNKQRKVLKMMIIKYLMRKNNIFLCRRGKKKHNHFVPVTKLRQASSSLYNNKGKMIFGEKYDEMVKIILIGDSGVGKTSFLNRFCYGTFKQHIQCTVGLECGQKIVTQAGKRSLVQLWDTAGQERFRNITPSFYRSAMAIILMYSADSRDSFNSVAVWMKQITAFAAEDVPILIICNKADITKKQVSEKESRALAQAYGLPLMIVSCLNNINVQESISELCKLVKRRPVNNRNLKRLKESSKSIQSCGC